MSHGPRSTPVMTVLVRDPGEAAEWARLARAGTGVAVTDDPISAGLSRVIVVDLIGSSDPAADMAGLRPTKITTIIAVAGEEHVAAARQAGASVVLPAPQQAFVHGLALAAAGRLHDGPVQSLTAARLQLSLAAQDRMSDRGALDAVDGAIETAAGEIAEVVDALRTLVRQD
jgi:hypothetical protein